MTDQEAPDQKKAGNRSKYNPDLHPIMAWEMAAIKDATNAEIAVGLGISTRTLWAWVNKYPEFRNAIKTGKSIADAKVVQALFRRCIGEKATERKIIKNPDGTARIELTEKEILPDVPAIRLWLINRKPEDWKDKQDVEHSGSVTWLDLVQKSCLQKI